MARNIEQKTAKKMIEERVQILNPSTGHFIQFDTTNGKIMGAQTKPFEGVRIKKTNIKFNPAIPKSIALKAEKAVIAVKQNKF
jgi:hypothetical protein